VWVGFYPPFISIPTKKFPPFWSCRLPFTVPSQCLPAARQINTGAPWVASPSITLLYPLTKTYGLGIMDHLSNALMVELIVWVVTVGTFTSSAFRTRSQLKHSRSTAGHIKPGSTGPRFWTKLTHLGQFVGHFVPPLIYWTTTASNKFRQSGWMAEYTLPLPPDVFGVDGVMVGRMVGLLVYFAVGNFGRIAMKCLGDQYSPIGVSGPILA